VLAGLRQYPQALMLSVLLHIGLLAVLFISLDSADEKKLIKQGEMTKTVKAQVVDVQQLEATKEKKQADIDKKKKAQEARKNRKLEAEKKKREEARLKAEATKMKQAEDRLKKAEARKKDEALKKKQAESKKKAEEKKAAEEKRKLAEVKQKKELEVAKAAEAKRVAEEKKKAETKRLADEKKKQAAKKRRIAEQEQKRKQDELKAQLKAEETQRRLSSARDAYRLAIQQKIERNWTRPQESGKFPECEIRVLQGPGGIILDVAFGACQGGSNTYRASIENAVYKAEPLPKPSDPALFDRELNIKFKPK